jgi:FkbM family methyltransferase
MKPEIVRRWFGDNGDKTLRVDYNLNEDSVVFDLGGYEGRWTNDIFQKYECNIYIFEPVSSFYNNINKRFSDGKIRKNNFGLSDKTFDSVVYLSNDASSTYQKTSSPENVKMVDICEFISNNNIDNIDLMKINIEGEEFNILEHLIVNDDIKIIDNIQVQFHSFAPNAIERRNKIREKLSETHEETYCYEFVWENWKRK